MTTNKLPEWRKSLNEAVENYQSTRAWYEENQDSPSAEQDMDAAAGEIAKLIKQYGVLIVLNLLDEIDELQERRKADNNERQPSPVLMWLSESYLVHLVSIHRRPVFRHENGDIMLSCQTIACFVDGYFAERRTLAYRQYLYAKLLILDKSNESGYLAHFGETPRLKPRGISLLNAMFNRFGFMIEEFGGCENLLKHMDKEIAGGNHVK
ncbi:hypothetical protein LF824_17555 [Citrobacter freundii]|uniref:hypothetical protein n=1 Tax=Citrobacter TaxID=544 RepID=UPI001F5F4A03|nr:MULTISPECIES: hypothetical protein [Citrobacter]MCO5616219.1 hypothetical protein [Citrobacter freundii]MCO5631292.1 hypothetical protein [Citrobacter freundii]MCO5632426.1 hypothetical protein [Citrobacter freundii]MCO5640294.1 hypothetical protein [Citrobacter freundii]MCO5646118.1 hypothetical protein [Citrobacter freundii]